MKNFSHPEPHITGVVLPPSGQKISQVRVLVAWVGRGRILELDFSPFFHFWPPNITLGVFEFLFSFSVTEITDGLTD